jgi:uncharacterized protein YqjF (DUF2071 family)
VRLPAPLEVDTFDRRAWLTVTPHWIRVQRVATMREVSVRTYVRGGGVYFTRLWTESALAVRVARALFKVRYDRAPVALVRAGDVVSFASPVFAARYGPQGAERPARDGLEEWLVERRRLFVADDTGVYRCEVHGPRWRLRDAWAEIEHDALTRDSNSLLLAWCGRHDVRIARPERIA